MRCTNATNFHRKSGGAKWRDLLSSSAVSNLNGNATLPFVIPTVAYPDFLPRCTGEDRVRAFL
jgi:hypothetical protein